MVINELPASEQEHRKLALEDLQGHKVGDLVYGIKDANSDNIWLEVR